MIVGLHDLVRWSGNGHQKEAPGMSRIVPGLGIFGLLVLLASGLAPPRVSAQATPVPPSGEQYTPIIQTVPSPPRWFTGSDGKVHLAYELLLTNAFAVPITVSAVDVLDAATGATVMPLTGDALLAAMSLMSVPGTPVVTLPPSSVGVVWFDIPLASADQIPTTITHRLTVTVPPGLPVPATITSIGAEAAVDLRPPVVLGAPLAGPGWAAVGSCCDGPHRRSLQPIDGGLYLAQRFAIDFNLLDAEHRLSAGDPGLLSSYPSYDQPVVAVADATVVVAVDRYPDQVPGQTVGVTLENADGNHVILDLGDGAYAFYAHLAPGSITVQAGDRVTQGQLIGRLGNSGSSNGPHLHFHVMDHPSALVADGLPYVFERFDLTGQIPPLAEAAPYYEAQQPLPITTTNAGPRRDELPLGSDVVTFPDPGA
jgi:hypothetical protein